VVTNYYINRLDVDDDDDDDDDDDSSRIITPG
jgi:hypothetical protein